MLAAGVRGPGADGAGCATHRQRGRLGQPQPPVLQLQVVRCGGRRQRVHLRRARARCMTSCSDELPYPVAARPSAPCQGLAGVTSCRDSLAVDLSSLGSAHGPAVYPCMRTVPVALHLRNLWTREKLSPCHSQGLPRRAPAARAEPRPAARGEGQAYPVARRACTTSAAPDAANARVLRAARPAP